MNAFHLTWAEYAGDILENGFKGGADGIVQLSDRPLDSTEIKGRSGGDVSLGIVAPEDVLTHYEDKNTHYRNIGVRVFKVPAEIMNMCSVHLHESNYIGFTRPQMVQILDNAKRSPSHLPGAPYPQAVVLEKALAFLGNTKG
jgi:hypothetical protein